MLLLENETKITQSDYEYMNAITQSKEVNQHKLTTKSQQIAQISLSLIN